MIATAFTALAICCSLTTAAQENDTFWLGADISGTTALEKHNMPLYDVKGQPCENTQLMPDIEVYNTPEDYLNGHDRQLERAVQEMMK